jgi:uroporphyrinogen decarboxylase
MGFKTGPIMNPKLINELFGPSYTRLVKAVHDRGGKYIQHSCGDNTQLFPYFIEWGIDGVHSMENTSNMDMSVIKAKYGDKLTFLGGVGIDHLLTEHATFTELKEGIEKLMRIMAPNGRFIIGPVHSESTIPASKLQMFLEVVQSTTMVQISSRSD